MKTKNPYRKFQGQQDQIRALERTNQRFKRVYTEYETMSEELWNFETSDGQGLPDDFINSIKIQTTYLEDEIQDWLQQAKQDEPK